MKISPDMRDMIDRAVAAGQVTVIPPGVSGGPLPSPTFPMPKKRGRPPVSDAAAEKRQRSATKAVQSLRDRRRFKVTPVAAGKPLKTAAADATGTVYPSRVFDPMPTEGVLKDGCSNSKIGGDVLKGHLKGARIFTLTLEERATCPKSCDLWRTCYGNGMPHPRRWKHGPALEAAIKAEVKALCATFPKVLVRLHILGDFYSFDYLTLWVGLLDDHPNLNVFGFTAWPPGTKIGDGIARVRKELGARFAIRHSGRTGEWGSFTVDGATERRRFGDAIVCPEQVEAERQTGRHCGNCALCWHSSLPIVFREH